MEITTKDATKDLFKFARRTPFNIAPEQAEKLSYEIFGSNNWSIHPSETEANFYAIPSDKKIYLSYAGLASLWCLSYAAFHIMNIASRQQRLENTSESESINIGHEFSVIKLGEYIAYSRRLFHSNLDWPCNLSKPKNVDASVGDDYLINNIFFGALSWIMLHEIAHVHHKDERFIPSNQRVQQEYKADSFATKWILDEAGKGLDREFRVLMISVALTSSFLSELELGKGSTHPPTILRFREAAQIFQMGERSAALENAAYLFKAVLDPETPAPNFDTPKEMFDWISSRLEEIFPV